MKIKKLILEGCIRLLYAGIARIEYTPESEYQLVIGTNGSGKSSLFAELSPLPAARQDFLIGGMKYIEIEADGVLYQLTSQFSHGSKHTFIRDGVVLNDAGTVTTQKELVFEHFKYTTELHQLLTGELRLTSMLPQQRREWISRACSYDVTYALQLFNKARAAARDALGARKHAETRLAVEYKGLYSDEELDLLRERIAALTRGITSIMLAVDSNALTRSQGAKQLEDALGELKAFSTDSILRRDAESLRGKRDVTSIQHELTSVEQERLGVDQQLNERRREYTELEDTLHQLTAMAGSGGCTLAEERDQLKAKLVEYYQHTTEFDYGEINYIQAHEIAEQLDNLLTDKLLALPPNVGKRFNQAALDEAQRKHDELVSARNVKNTELTRQLTRREQMVGAERTTCPSCGYMWIPGVSDVDLKATNEKIELLGSQMDQLSAAHTRNQKWLDEINEWRRLFLDFRQIVTANPILGGLWKEFIKSDLLYDDPNACVHIFYRWKDQLKVIADRTKLEQRIDEIETVLKRASEIAGGGSTQYLTQRATVLGERISELTQKSLALQDKRNQLVAIAEDAIGWENIKERLNLALQSAHRAAKDFLNAQINEGYRQSIEKQQTELAQLTFQLTEKTAAKDTVAMLEKQCQELTQLEADYKFIAEELSPTSGMIADQLSTCINALVDQMNDLIGQVWTYDMAVLPCGLDSADLDYKFPIEIKGRPKHVPDISKGSGAQSAFIDFTFILVYLGFSELHGYPLFPDELGSTFDPEHRIRIVEFFKRLVESRRTGQIFYISHNPEAHDILVNADVVVLDSANVGEIPDANRVFKIEYAA